MRRTPNQTPMLFERKVRAAGRKAGRQSGRQAVWLVGLVGPHAQATCMSGLEHPIDVSQGLLPPVGWFIRVIPIPCISLANSKPGGSTSQPVHLRLFVVVSPKSRRKRTPLALMASDRPFGFPRFFLPRRSGGGGA